jgi:hypothetical protein
MARVISSTSEYLDRRNPAAVSNAQDSLAKNVYRNKTFENFGKILSAADKVVTSPAVIGVASVLKAIAPTGEATVLNTDDLKQKAVQAKVGPIATEPVAIKPTDAEVKVADLVVSTYGRYDQIPANVLKKMTPGQLEAAKSRSPLAPLTPAVTEQPSPSRVEVSAESQRMNQEAAARAEEIAGQKELALAEKRKMDVEEAVKDARDLMKIADRNRQLRDIALQEGNQAEANMLEQEYLSLQRQAKSRVAASGLDWEMVGQTVRAADAKKQAAAEVRAAGTSFSEVVAKQGNQIIDAGQAMVESEKIRLMEKEAAGTLSIMEGQLLDYLEEFAARPVGSVARTESPRGTRQNIAQNSPVDRRAPEPAPPMDSVAASEAEAPASSQAGAGMGPAELINQRIEVLQAQRRRSPYEDIELMLLKNQRPGETLPPQQKQTGQATESMPSRRNVATAASEPLDLSSEQGIMAAARMADTAEKQSAIVRAAYQVIRPEARQAATVFEALGFGVPTRPSSEQIRMVTSLFPKIETTSEMDLASAQSLYARAELTRQQAKLAAENAETERLIRGGKVDEKIASGELKHANAIAAIRNAESARIRALKSGKRGSGLAAAKKVEATNKAGLSAAASSVNSRNQQNDADIGRIEAEIKATRAISDPGPKPVLQDKYPDSVSRAKHNALVVKWREKSYKYDNAKQIAKDLESKRQEKLAHRKTLTGAKQEIVGAYSKLGDSALIVATIENASKALTPPTEAAQPSPTVGAPTKKQPTAEDVFE